MPGFQQYTLADLQAQLQDEYDGAAFWTDEESRIAINDALRTYNLLTGYWCRRPTPIPTVANQVFYSVPATLTMNLRMTFNLLSMELGSLAEYDNGRPYWQGETTADGGDVPTRPRAYLPSGLRTFAIWPADAAGGGSLLVDGLAATPVLVNAGDFIDIGAEDVGVIVDEALHVAAFKIRGSREWQATFAKHREFLQACADRNSRLATSSYFRKYLGLDREKDYVPIRGRGPAPPTGDASGSGV